MIRLLMSVLCIVLGGIWLYVGDHVSGNLYIAASLILCAMGDKS